MEIYGKITKLRAVEEKDIEFLRHLINDPHIESKTGGWNFPIAINQQKKWYGSLSDNKNLNLSICKIEDTESRCIGMLSLAEIDWKNRCTSHGIKLSEEERGKGIGKDVVLSIMKYVFEELNLNRLETTILESNKASQKLHIEKCGWKKEGIKREAIFKNGKYQDNLMVAITKKDYESLKDKIGWYENDKKND